jgi:hypothetical protein
MLSLFRRLAFLLSGSFCDGVIKGSSIEFPRRYCHQRAQQSEPAPTQLEGLRGPNSEPNIVDFLLSPSVGAPTYEVEGVKRSGGVGKRSGGVMSAAPEDPGKRRRKTRVGQPLWEKVFGARRPPKTCYRGFCVCASRDRAPFPPLEARPFRCSAPLYPHPVQRRLGHWGAQPGLHQGGRPPPPWPGRFWVPVRARPCAALSRAPRASRAPSLARPAPHGPLARARHLRSPSARRDPRKRPRAHWGLLAVDRGWAFKGV